MRGILKFLCVHRQGGEGRRQARPQTAVLGLRVTTGWARVDVVARRTWDRLEGSASRTCSRVEWVVPFTEMGSPAGGAHQQRWGSEHVKFRLPREHWRHCCESTWTSWPGVPAGAVTSEATVVEVLLKTWAWTNVPGRCKDRVLGHSSILRRRQEGKSSKGDWEDVALK